MPFIPRFDSSRTCRPGHPEPTAGRRPTRRGDSHLRPVGATLPPTHEGRPPGSTSPPSCHRSVLHSTHAPFRPNAPPSSVTRPLRSPAFFPYGRRSAARPTGAPGTEEGLREPRRQALPSWVSGPIDPLLTVPLPFALSLAPSPSISPFLTSAPAPNPNTTTTKEHRPVPVRRCRHLPKSPPRSHRSVPPRRQPGSPTIRSARTRPISNRSPDTNPQPVPQQRSTRRSAETLWPAFRRS